MGGVSYINAWTYYNNMLFVMKNVSEVLVWPNYQN